MLSPKPNIKDGESENEESVGEMTWPSPIFDKTSRLVAAKQAQLLRKKRIHSASFSHSGINGLSVAGIPADVSVLAAALRRNHISATRLPYGKNSKKSRDGRRIPNKRGGKKLEDPTDVLDEIELDKADPDYDSDASDTVVLEELRPALTDEEADRIFLSLLKELFVHGKTEEVVDYLVDLNLAPHQRRRLPYLAVTTALQHKQTQFELTSELLSDMCDKILNQALMQQGFLLILNEINDIIIDVPRAPEHVGRFIARAILDEILPPKFLEHQKSVLSQGPLVHGHGDSINTKPLLVGVDCPLPSSHPNLDLSGSPGMTALPHTRPGTRNFSDSSGSTRIEDSFGSTGASNTTISSGIGSASSLVAPNSPHIALDALERAQESLTLSRAFARLDNIWGVPAGPRATKSLVKKIHRILISYNDSDDLEDATAMLLNLDSPHFHHELVYQGVIMAVELSTDDARTRIVRLLDSLCHSVVITPNQLTLGIRRVYAELPELILDVPAAYLLTERFINAALAAGFVSKKLASECPSKHRKRYVSENNSLYRTKPLQHPL